jgi:hypothetical protein
MNFKKMGGKSLLRFEEFFKQRAGGLSCGRPGQLFILYTVDSQFTSYGNSDLHVVLNCDSNRSTALCLQLIWVFVFKEGQVSKLPRKAKYTALLMACLSPHWFIKYNIILRIFLFTFDTVISVNRGCPRIR